MDREQIQDFTLRLSQCNKGGMILITYEIFFAYLEDARSALKAQQREDYKTAIRKAQRTLDELMGALDFQYEISRNLYGLYVFSKNELAKAMYEGKLDRIDTAEHTLKRLYQSFEKAAAQDTSEPIMRNTQSVYAGMTYGRNHLADDYMEIDTHRGFLA